ncbi:MAG TPA: LysR family transcriptional regulator [Dermatophilaceae bacterium]|nr:LysR family transcriptional regulator [Dermatophilaceae bacterium]
MATLNSPLHPKALRYLTAVAQLGSVQAAAREVSISASAIDRQILMLEEDMGVPLFERLPRGMRLTAAGELLLDSAREAYRRQLPGRGYRPEARIVAATLGNDAGVVGAADLARHHDGSLTATALDAAAALEPALAVDDAPEILPEGPLRRARLRWRRRHTD